MRGGPPSAKTRRRCATTAITTAANPVPTAAPARRSAGGWSPPRGGASRGRAIEPDSHVSAIVRGRIAAWLVRENPKLGRLDRRADPPVLAAHFHKPVV